MVARLFSISSEAGAGKTSALSESFRRGFLISCHFVFFWIASWDWRPLYHQCLLKILTDFQWKTVRQVQTQKNQQYTLGCRLKLWIQAHVGEQFMVMLRNHQYMHEHYRPAVCAYRYIRVSTYMTCTIFSWLYTVLDRAVWEISATRSTIGTNTPHRRAISPHFHNLHHQTLRLSKYIQGKLNLFVIVVNLMYSRIWLDVRQNEAMVDLVAEISQSALSNTVYAHQNMVQVL
jgi:hypothetical protein